MTMSPSKKIIFLDVDGTLVDYEGSLPPSAKEAVQRARKNGHRVYICTGRSKAEVYDDLWEMGLDGMIGGNGSYVEHNGEVVFAQFVSLKQATRIVDWLKERNLDFYLESNAGLFASEGFEEAGEKAVREYSRRKGQSGASEMTLQTAFPNMIFGGNLYRDDLNKVSFILKSYQDYLDAKEAFPDMKVGTWGGASQKALFGDIGVKNISKASAIAALLAYIGGRAEDTIAFGDAVVDIPMMDCCAVGVAMGNAQEEVKRVADFVAGDVNEDGLLHAFEDLGLID